jgi:predicted amidohydrolase
LSDIPDNTDIVVLPEMFSSGFTQNPEPLYGNQATIEWMKAQATQHNIALVGSIACAVERSGDQQNNFVNRLLFVTPDSAGHGDGELHYYDKCHLFAMGGEHERYQAGKQRSVVAYKGWRFLLTVCYDLRFPVFCRNRNDYDVMLCVANWPQSRRHVWRTLLQARAIENQAYVLGVNRVGKDGNGLAYSGDSMVVNFWGDIVADGPQGKEQILNATLDSDTLLAARKSFPVGNDADAFELT